MKKLYLIIIILAIIIILMAIFRAGGEDSWIKDERGVWVKHGNPSSTPEKVEEQQALITAALELYNQQTEELVSQCLGTIGDYAVDIVHVPRSDIDNQPENQCEAYRNGEVSHFIELDKDGNVVWIE